MSHPARSDRFTAPNVGKIAGNGFVSKSLPRGMRMPHGLTEHKNKRGQTCVKNEYDAREIAKRLSNEREEVLYNPDDD